MAEAAISFVLEQLYQLVKEEGSLLKGLGNEFSDIIHELDSIKAFLKDADRKAGVNGDTNEGIKTWVKQVREVSFRIEDVIDEYYTMDVARQINHDPPWKKIAPQIKTLMSRHRIASEIQDIKSSVRVIKERSERYIC
ncbi:putative disease resistance protein [Spatholobus suberectus]|nr:putative disease resistance protein [Spatholobus suberectus]